LNGTAGLLLAAGLKCEMTEDNCKQVLRKAPANLKPEHHGKPIGVEPDDQPS
jgi:hypothetical protein